MESSKRTLANSTVRNEFRMSKTFMAVFVALVMVTSPFIAIAATEPAPEIWPSKDAYVSGEQVVIYGKNWEPLVSVEITLNHPDFPVALEYSVVAIEDGTFTFSDYYATGVMQFDIPVDVTATQTLADGTVLTATCQFLDPAVLFEGYTLSPHPTWTTGVIKGYNEGDSVPYRVTLSKKFFADPDESNPEPVPAQVWMAHDTLAYDREHHGVDYYTEYPGETGPFNTYGPSTTPFSVIEGDGFITSQVLVGYLFDDRFGVYLLVWKFTLDWGSDDAVTVGWGAHLALTSFAAEPDYLGASWWPGASLHGEIYDMQPEPDSGDRDIPIDVVGMLMPPEMTLDKAGDKDVLAAGETITFTISWSNIGQATACDVVITDTVPYVLNIDETSFLMWTSEDPSPVSVTPVIVGNEITYEVGDWPGTGADSEDPVLVGYLSFEAVADQPVSGDYLNVVTLTYTDDHDGYFDPLYADWPFSIVAEPELLIVKTGVEQAHVGDVIEYTYYVENTGDTDLTIDVVDDVLGPIATGLFLAAGAWTTLTASYEIESLPVDYQIHNIVTATGEDDYGQTAMDTDSWTVEILFPELDVTKAVSKACAEVGEEVWYTITYLNPSYYTTLYDVEIYDPLLGSWYIGTLMPREGDVIMVPFLAIETHPDDPDGELVNTVSAWGYDELGLLVEDSDRCVVNIYHPMIEITKEANLRCAEPGETVIYWINVTNPTSDTPMYAEVWDLMISVDPLFMGWLEPGQMVPLGPFGVIVPINMQYLDNIAYVHAWDPQEHHVYEEAIWSVMIYHPAIELDKYADKDVAEPGETVNYYFLVSNPSPDATMDVDLYDSMLGGYIDSVTLAPGGSWTFGPYPYVMPDSPDPVVNTAHVWAYDCQNHDEYAEDSWTVDLVYPGIEIRKWSEWVCAEEGETVEYYFDVHNSGDIALDYEVFDPLLSDVAIASGSLAPGAWAYLGPFEYVVPADSEWVVNTAHVVAEDIYGHVRGDESSWEIEIFHPAISIDKYADKSFAEPGETVTYWIDVLNPSADATMDAYVYDPMLGGYLGHVQLAPGGSWTFGPYPVAMPEGPDMVVNTAYVDAFDHQDHDEYAEDSWTVDLVYPGIEIYKWSEWVCAEEGELVYYFIDLYNPSPDVAMDYEVFDPLLSDVTLASGTLEPLTGVSLGPFEYVVPADSEWVMNTATVVAEDEFGHVRRAQSSWEIEIFHPAISIDKYADMTMAHVGDTITYYIDVDNPSHDATMDAYVYDPMLGGYLGYVQLSPLTGVTFGPYYYVVQEGDEIVSNTAYVEAWDHQLHYRYAEDSWDVEILYPCIDVTKTGPEYATVGDIITYTVTVTNCGNTPLYDVEVWDSLVGLVKTYAMLAVLESDTFTYTFEVPPGDGTLVNTVVADGFDIIGGYVFDEDTWTVIKYGEVSGFKRADMNRDGVVVEGEPGLMGWTIELYGILDEGGTDIRTTITDTDGYYEFTMLKPGVYTVTEVMQTGWIAYTPIFYEFTVGSGMAFEFSFGNMPEIEICGYKWEDMNLNGIWDEGEPGIEGWTIYLEGGQIPPGEPLIAVTDEFGHYCFSDLLPGLYYVTEETRAGWLAMTSITVEVAVDEFEPFEREVNFGNAMYGSITGFKWLDEYMNGYKDGNEIFLEGWVIWIEGTLANGEHYGPYSTTTDSNGVYVFSGLLPGEYTVWEELPAGWVNTTPWMRNVTIEEGSYVHCAKFGNVELGSIDGWKFLDWDMDGMMDGNEPGIPGWEITLTGWLNDGAWPWAPDGATPVGPITIVTDADGYWMFDDLLPGIYMVTEASADGWYHVTPTSVTLWIASGTHVVDVKFGNVPYNCFEVYKFDDLNGNGVWDEREPGIAGWEITITGVQNDGVPVNIRLVTDESGYAATCFIMLPGEYVIEEVMQEGWMATTQSSYQFVTPICLEPWMAFAFEFGNFKLGMIFGYKFQDMDGDGILDPEDTPIEGWEIYLYPPEGGMVMTLTDVNGYYEFTGLHYGLYVVEEESRLGWMATTATSHDALVTSGAHVEVPVFLNFMYGCISGYKWEDLNGDGIWDAGEPAIPRWPIYLDDNGILDESEDLMVYTDEDGFYSFCMLAPGTYTVYEIVPSGWIATTTTSHTVVITSGMHATDLNFGNFELVMLTLFKFEDIWGDGVYDDLEDYGLEGWAITVVGPGVPGGSVTVFTDEFGYAYVWVDAAGTYTVTEEDRLGWCHTTPPVVYVDVISGSASPSAYVEFGNFECVDLIIFKFEDVNSNGVYDPGIDVPIRGWSIVVSEYYSGYEAVMVTDENGEIHLHICEGGLWTFVEGYVEGWTQTLPAEGGYSVLVTSGMALNTETQEEQRYYEFGNFQCVEILVFKYWDLDSDGQYEPIDDEIPLPRWLMTLYKMVGPDEWEEVASAYTDENGEVLFRVCEAGTYKVVEADVMGWAHITPLSGEYVFDVLSGDSIELWFGNFQCVEILIFKYEDRDSNGVFDNDDTPIPDWEFTVTGPAFDLPVVVTTDEYGYASVTVCRAGEYTIVEEDRDGWTHIDPASGMRQVCVLSGMQVPVQEFGNFRDVEIVVFKFDDIFADGQYCPDDGDVPIEGWLIELYLEVEPGVWVLVDHKLTGPDGYASFIVSQSGHYKVVEEAVPGWWWIYPTTGEHEFWVYSSDILLPFVFANFKMGMIFGYKWNDLNGNGEWDEGEPALEGWTISFETLEGFYMFGTTTTDENGYYEFTGLPPGLYMVWEEVEPGWVPTSDPSVAVEIWGHSMVRVDFFNFEEGCIEGYKYEDVDGNGVYDPDVDLPIEGWMIYLSITGWEETPEGVISFITLIDWVLTDEDGYYKFCGLGPGTYVVSEESREGWIHTSAPSETVIMTSGALIVIHDFLNFELGSICGYKFEDLNSNGEWDEGEPAIEGWPIYMVRDDLPTVYVTYTDEEGKYCFDDLEADYYVVYEIVPLGWVATTPTSHMVVITSGDHETVPDFGNFECVDITIFKYEDVNGNGVFDDGDNPIEGWEFTVSGPAFDVPLVVVTGEEGYVIVTVCEAGEYTVTEEDRDGWMHVNPADGYLTVQVQSGDRLVPLRFGNFEMGTIIVTKFYDWDMDGTMGIDEVGLQNWVIWLNGTLVGGGSIDISRLTDGSGEVRFDSLPAGTYVVSERLEYAPPGWEPTTPPSVIVDITSGSQSAVMIGNVLLGDIWGYKFYDKNLDGIWDDNEPGLEGWTILLTGTDDMGNPVDLSTRTNEDGYYEFLDLHPGLYHVDEVLPDTWTATTDLPVEVDFSGAQEEFGAQVNIGNIQYAKIWGYKFQDLYEECYPFWPNGVFDPDEWGLGNWEITLQGRDINGDLVSLVRYTDNIEDIGYYEFTHLLPGTYWVNETLLFGWYATTPISNMVIIYPFPLGPVIMHIDFGNLVPSEDPELKFVLSKGWNLWSTPLIIDGGLTAKGLLEAIGTTGIMVTKLDIASQKWVSYVRGDDAALYDFAIEFGEGCYVWVSSDTTFKLKGDLAFHGKVPLAKGWNVMGYTSLKPVMASELLGMIDGTNAWMITYLDTETGKYVSYVKGDLEKFDFVVTQGRAFFIWLEGSGSLVY